MGTRAIYWDASALVAALFDEERSAEAVELIQVPAARLMSSLAWAEVHATLARAVREGRISSQEAACAATGLGRGPWRRVRLAPDDDLAAALARAWPLRGADLWPLALAKTLLKDLPELEMASYDRALAEAAAGEGVRAAAGPQRRDR